MTGRARADIRTIVQRLHQGLQTQGITIEGHTAPERFQRQVILDVTVSGFWPDLMRCFRPLQETPSFIDLQMLQAKFNQPNGQSLMTYRLTLYVD